MIFLGNLMQVDSESFRVGLIHYMPFDEENGLKNEDGSLMSVEQLEPIGILVEEIAEPQPPVGQEVGGTFVNRVTKQVFYEYVTPQKTQEEFITELQENKELMQAALDELILGGAL